MKLLVVDGNSLINRAFYGIKLLTAKDGHYTNAIFGFFNMLFSLTDSIQPDGVAVAFDLKAPTFRHQMYDAYKAGRKGMPPELHEQVQPVKDLILALGYHIISLEGYEADDILGTLSAGCTENDHCYIATGDRDSLQLVRDNVTVLLTATKGGQTVLTHYTPQTLYEEYGVSPLQMIELKALQGDSSDNIPGVSGIGPKTAGDLIKMCGSVEKLYEQIDNIKITPNVKNKLLADKHNAFLSRKLGEICLSVPIDNNPAHYKNNDPDKALLFKLLSMHELMKFIKRLGLDSIEDIAEQNCESRTSIVKSIEHGALLDELRKEKVAYFLFEMQSPDIENIVFSFPDGLYYCNSHDLFFADFIKELLEDASIAKYTSDLKNLYAWTIKHDVSVQNVAMDVQLAGYLLNPNATDYSVRTQCIGLQIIANAVQCADSSVHDEDFVSLCEDASVFRLLCDRLQNLLVENEQDELLRSIEIPLCKVLADMESSGFLVDKNGIVAFSEKLQEAIEQTEQEIYAETGQLFNINSPKQLGEILFEKMKLPHGKKTKTGYSTNAEILESLAADYPVVRKILDYRAYTKLRSTYCEGMLKLIADDGRIRSTFNQTETRTGRLSSSEPNLQNIPVRTDLGREMRKFFVAKEGCVLVDADYSQIELRVLAAAADDENMCEAFRTNTDIHTVTASQVFNMPMDMITPLLRSRAKAVNFGIVYGIGAFSLAKDIGVSRAEADSYIKKYLAHYAGVSAYMEQCIQRAKDCGYSETLLKRRRYLPELRSSNGMLRAFGERVARNMPIQGTAADIIKIAMIRVYNRLQNELPDVKLIMQVHDELILEAPEPLAGRAAEILKEEMENAMNLQVPLAVDVHIGKTWYDAKG